MPQLRCLPVDGPDQAPNHGPRRLLHFSKAKVGDLGGALGCDEDVRRFAIPMDDGWFPKVKVLQSTSNVKHHT